MSMARSPPMPRLRTMIDWVGRRRASSAMSRLGWVASAELAPAPAVEDEPSATITTKRCAARRRAVRLSGRSSRVRSAGASQRGALASVAAGVGATATRLPSANAPAKRPERIRYRIAKALSCACGHAPSAHGFAPITDCRGQSSAASFARPQRTAQRARRWNLYGNLIWRTGADGPETGTLGPAREFPRKIFDNAARFARAACGRSARGRNAMVSTDATAFALSPAEHQVQLRRAVIASTIGTAIEWYDFFLYSTVTGLVFAKLFFPNSDPWVGTLEAFAIYAVGFVARPVGAAIFGHYGDRIGRKSTLIATLLLMGLATFAVALVPTYESIGIWGAVLLTILRFIQGVGVGGEWGGSVLMSME